MGTDKNVQHMCDMNNLHMQQGGFFVSVRSVGTWGALLGGAGAGVGRGIRMNVDMEKRLFLVWLVCEGRLLSGRLEL